MIKHTPGPWKVIISDFGNAYVRDVGGLIAELPKSRRYKSEFGEYEANAKLIAAAPDLLAALEAARTQLITLGGVADLSKYGDAIQAVVIGKVDDALDKARAKAKGEAWPT